MPAITFPLATIDFEASSLELTSYPIEVGVAVAREAGGAVEVWSALIRPDPAWDVGDAWDADAERVHGIARRRLADGLTPAATLDELNRRLGPIGQAWCDDPKYDPFWLRRLCAAAAPVTPAFRLAPVALAFALDRRAHNRFADALAASDAPHRAGPDAERMCRALIYATQGEKLCS